jgi:DNA-binding FadR family transcriptional regulator
MTQTLEFAPATNRPRRRGLHAHLVQTIADRIVTGVYAEGQALPRIEDLATEFDSSRVAVREALRVLVEKGLIDSRQKSGTRVRPRSTWNLADPDVIAWQALASPNLAFFRDLSEVRAMIEPFAANLAAHRATEEERQQLQVLLDRMGAAIDDPAEFSAADIALHSAILAASHNKILLHLTNTIAEALAASRAVTTRSRAKSEASQPLHAVVVAEIIAGRGEQASQATHLLIGEAFVDIKELLEAEADDADATSPLLTTEAAGQQ